MQNSTNLANLKCGEKAKISHFKSTELPAKFYELGFSPGAVIEMKHKAPFNGPICVNITENNTLIAIRKSEAQLIIAEKI